MNSKKGSCHSTKCRREFLYENIKNANSDEVNRYFKMMGKLGVKDKRFIKYLMSDLKYCKEK